MNFPYRNVQTSTEYFDSEVLRLNKMLVHDCALYYDPKHVWVTVGEWQRTLMSDIMDFMVEEKMISMEQKQLVRMKGLAGGKIAYGFVAANYSVFVKQNNTFEDLAPADALLQQARQQNEMLKPIDHEHRAELIFVRWFDKNDVEICQGWHNADTLEAY